MFTRGLKQSTGLITGYKSLLKPARVPSQLRTFANMSNKFTFLVYAPDYTDAEAFSRRMAVRDQHLARAKSLLQEGVVGAYIRCPSSEVHS